MSSAQGTRAARPKEAVLQRSYDVTPEACASAIALLLQSPIGKKNAAGMTTTNGDDTKERSVHDFRATENYTR